MKDTLSYAVTAEGEENLGACVNRLREWIDALPERAKVRVSIRATVKEAGEAEAMSKTSDMFKAGEVKDGVQRKRLPRGARKLAAVPSAGANGAEHPAE